MTTWLTCPTPCKDAKSAICPSIWKSFTYGQERDSAWAKHFEEGDRGKQG